MMRLVFFLRLAAWLALAIASGLMLTLTLVYVFRESSDVPPPDRFLWSLLYAAITAVLFVLQLHALFGLTTRKR